MDISSDIVMITELRRKVSNPKSDEIIAMNIGK